MEVLCKKVVEICFETEKKKNVLNLFIVETVPEK